MITYGEAGNFKSDCKNIETTSSSYPQERIEEARRRAW